MFLQKENKSIDEIGMKEKIIYERRKSSLKEIFLAFLSPKKSREVQMAKLQKNSREVRSVKASLCTSFLKKGKYGGRNRTCSSVVFSWNGYTDLFYGHI